MTLQLTQGGNAVVSATGSETLTVKLNWQVPAGYELDASVFMLTEKGVVPNDEAMIFFNQPVSPDQAVQYQAQMQQFSIVPAKLDKALQRLVFTVTIYEGNERRQQFKQLTAASISITKDGHDVLRYDLVTGSLQEETALIFAELYLNKGQWKFRAIGQGFKCGLTALCKHFGVSVAEEPLAQTASTPATEEKVSSVEKKLAHAPGLLALTRTAKISLQKIKLDQHHAKVGICLDISMSMADLYSSGKIQNLAEKVLALACEFDDKASIDVFLFGQQAYHAEEMGLNNFADFTGKVLQQYQLEAGSCYGKVMKLIRNFYFPIAEISIDKPLLIQTKLPVYVIFVTANDTSDPSETLRQLKGSSYESIFWQFIRIAKSKNDEKKSSAFVSLPNTEFSFWGALDNLSGRYVDNAGFFSAEDPARIADAEFYDLLMAEYAAWVKQAQAKKLLQ